MIPFRIDDGYIVDVRWSEVPPKGGTPAGAGLDLVGVPPLGGSWIWLEFRLQAVRSGTMNIDRKMYRWRTMTDEQRQETLQHRKRQRLPWHSPPHFHAESELYLITAACYEHAPIIGVSD